MRFGTDGVRGRAHSELTEAMASDLGRAIARVFFGTSVVIGGDSRESTLAFITAVSQGLINGGAEVESLGMVPTPVVAAESSRRNAVGVVISASHNPFFDNGIKVFGPGGVKLSTETEAQIEAEWNRQDASDEVAKPSGNMTTGEMADVQVRYLERITSAIEQRSLQGIRVVIDAANGAASELAGEVFASVGADVVVIHADPNGTNINDGCGATHTQSLQEAVLAYGADVGLALDGDADRLIAVDHLGNLVDGDRVIAILAGDMRSRGMLSGNTVVVTVMANLGFRRAMTTAGIEVVETPVGDRHVLEALIEGGFSLGGEQSGHIIIPAHATTGDGMLTGVVLLDAVVRSGQSLAELSSASMKSYPQVLINVPVPVRGEVPGEAIREVRQELEGELGDDGRILIRPSGTEPLVRVMVEAALQEDAERIATTLADAIERSYEPMNDDDGDE
ncbi:MAG: phosphoglucosamine mutase [Ilumatobacteraceae bacterium]